ncbi:MAG: hypothetical protein ACRC8M_00455 [Cetobacterium sp.]
MKIKIKEVGIEKKSDRMEEEGFITRVVRVRITLDVCFISNDEVIHF